MAAVHSIRRAAILGIPSRALSVNEIQDWADRREPGHFLPRLAAGEVIIAGDWPWVRRWLGIMQR